MKPARLNWGCGPQPAAGWINSDVIAVPGVDLCCDIRNGLPIDGASIEYAVAMHALQDLQWLDVPVALGELHRVLAPGGVLRLGLPDLDRAIDAYRRGDRDYFYIPDDDARSLSGKLITQIIWYGSVRTPFTFDFIEELLLRAGFRCVTRCEFQRTASRFPDIVRLDNRPRETLFVEAEKAAVGEMHRKSPSLPPPR
jgi:SAM-dependent methyltransferase